MYRLNLNFPLTILVTQVVFLLPKMISAQITYDPSYEVTALVQIVDYTHTGDHISSGNMTLKVEEVYSGILRDSVVKFEGLEDEYIIDKVFARSTMDTSKVDLTKPFVLKFTFFQDKYVDGGPYYVIWASSRERKESLEKLEKRLTSFKNEYEPLQLAGIVDSPISALKTERWGRMYTSFKDSSLVFIETSMGSGEWVVANPEDGYLNQNKMDIELLKKEKDWRIFYVDKGLKKVAHRQNPWSDYWFFATIIED